MKSQVSTYVELKRVTLYKDSHDLFDYESKNVYFSKEKVKNSVRIYKELNEIMVKPISNSETEIEVDNPDCLCSIIRDSENPDRFTVITPDVQNSESGHQNLFLVVRSLKNEDGNQQGYPLELDDIIRLGHCEYKVIEYQDHNRVRHSLFDLNKANQSEIGNLTVKKSETDTNEKLHCRLCLMNKNESDDILIDPCNCKGGDKYMHINCLQAYMNDKVESKSTDNFSCWLWAHPSCEICNSVFPDMLEINGKKVEFVPIHKPDTPYMLLERTSKVDNSRTLILFTITNEEYQIKMGRGDHCDVRETDTSLSHLHAFIRYENSKFVIVDNYSKFGTLILLQKGFDIKRRKIAIQIGKVVMTFSLKHSVTSVVPPKLTNPIVLEKK